MYDHLKKLEIDEKSKREDKKEIEKTEMLFKEKGNLPPPL